MNHAILILNAGSSSVKFSVFERGDPPRHFLRGQVESLALSPTFRAFDADGRAIGEHAWAADSSLQHVEAVDYILSWCRREGLRGRSVVAAGHRVVHGGLKYDRPVRVDRDVLADLESLVPLAPLHQPHNLAAIAAVTRFAPDLPQVACFDTAFHRTRPVLAQIYAIPRAHTDAGVRSYGFHGLSYEYIASALTGIDARAASGRTIVAHLGNGASMCAMLGGKSIATTMGFTTIDGLVMGTRSGLIDPGVVLYLNQHCGMSIDDIRHMLYEQSGLLGVSGISGDMRTLLSSDDPRAKEATDLFVYRAARELGSLAAAMGGGGVDAIVFTGGIGENAAPIRAAICEASRWLGVELDQAANARRGPCITAPASRVAAWVIPTNEELMIARHTMDILSRT